MSGLALLLESDDFGTDSESSVLALLAVWVKSRRFVSAAERAQLCGLVRLSQLSKPYLEGVLPALAADHEAAPDEPKGWFPIKSVEGQPHS